MLARKPRNRRRRPTQPTTSLRGGLRLTHARRMGLAGFLGLTVGVGLCYWLLTAEQSGPDARVPLAMPHLEERVKRLPMELRPQGPVGPEAIVDTSRLDLSQAKLQNQRYVQTLPDGRSVSYTLVPAVQQRVEKILADYAPPYAAFVAVDPQNGKVLAFADHRSSGPSSKSFALQASQPAASLFKIVTAASLLENEGIQSRQRYCYHGGGRGVKLAHLRANAKLDKACRTFGEALAHSTNTIFARLADKHLTPQKLTHVANQFGFEEEIPFVWPVANSRVTLPSKRVPFAAASAGFHHTTISPLHAALMTAGIANDGKIPTPHIVDRIQTGTLNFYQAKPSMLRTLASVSTTNALTRMMELTTTQGTAAKYFSKAGPELKGVRVAGKTGSLSSQIGGARRHNSWFVGFAPAENPTIAVAALVVNDPKWRIKSTYLAREALEAFFSQYPAKKQDEAAR